jgi:hypothetical protein
MRLRFLAIAVCFFLSGCIHSAGGIASSTKPLEPGSYEILGETLGRDCIYHILLFIPISGSNETKTAVARAISHKEGATALINVSIENFRQNFIVFSRGCTSVHGTAVREQEPTGQTPAM